MVRTDRKPPPRGILKPVRQGRSPDSRVTQNGSCHPRQVRCLPMGTCPQWLKLRTPSLTVAGAVQELRRTSATHLFPVSSAGRDRP